jgi:hypothetical protein
MKNRKQAGQLIRIGARWYVRYWERRNIVHDCSSNSNAPSTGVHWRPMGDLVA